MSDTAWFLLADDRRRGPFATAELQQVLLRHPDSGAQLVWHSGLTEWVPASTQPEFAPSVPPQPPQTKTMSEFPSEGASPAVVVKYRRPTFHEIQAFEVLDPRWPRGWSSAVSDREAADLGL